MPAAWHLCRRSDRCIYDRRDRGESNATSLESQRSLIPLIYSVVLVAVLVGCVLWAAFFRPGAIGSLRLVAAMLAGLNILMLLGGWMDAAWATDQSPAPLSTTSGQAYVRLFLHHLLPALFLGWTVREALVLFVPLLLIEATLSVIVHLQMPEAHPNLPTDLLLLGLCGVPGAVVCWVRHRGMGRSTRSEVYRDAWDTISREIRDARKLHESLFPDPIDNGPLRLKYAYRPMNQLGGDYLHARLCPGRAEGQSALLCVLIDVTGHGLRATLAVNQLHALLMRQARAGLCQPGEVMAELNSYMHAHFAEHSVFATAICIRLDPDQRRVDWCSAGHPPAIVSDRVRCEPSLDSTTFMLGAMPEEDFDPSPREMTLPEGAEIVAYSDGVTEKRLAIGKLLGVQGLCMFIARLLAREDMSCQGLMDSLDKLNAGAREDDVLVVRLGFTPRKSETLPSLARLNGHASNSG